MLGKKAMRKLTDLSEAGREELALALILWRDFKTTGRPGRMDVEVIKQMCEFAEMLGVTDDLHRMMPKVSPMKITAR